MKILILGFLHPKKDKRVFRTVKALSKEHRITYVYWTKKEEVPYEEKNIKYIPFFHHIKSNALKEMISRRKLENKIFEYINSQQFDLAYLHHYANTMPVKIYKFLSQKRIPVITDFHEYIPDDFFAGVSKIPEKFRYFIGNRVFKKIIKKIDGGVFVSDWMIKKAKKIDDFEPFWLPNYGSFKIQPVPKEKRKNEIVFVGTTSRNLDKEKIILEKLSKSGLKITIVGMKKGEYSFANCLPFMPYDDMIKKISESAFSLISYDYHKKNGSSNENFVHSMPNKFFDAICSGVPVILDKNFVDMSELIQQDQIGIIIDRNNPEDSALKIKTLWENNFQYNELLSNIKNCQEKYLWNSEKENAFVDFVKNFQSNIRRTK